MKCLLIISYIQVQYQLKGKIMKTIYIIIILICMSFNLFGQQSILSDFYMINPYIVNAAEAGKDNTFSSFISLREQWVGIEGAPSTAFLTASMPISNKLSAGFKIINDNIHLYNQLNALATLNYRLQINKNQNIHFAISSGVVNNKLDTKKAVVENESDILYYEDLSGVSINADFGIKYTYSFVKNNVIDFGFSANNLFANEVKFILNDSQGNDYYSLNRNYNFYINYINSSLKDWDVQPMILMRFSEIISKYQTDIGLMSTYKNLVWGNIIYRFDESIIIGAGVNVLEDLSVAYSYGYGFRGISNNSNGSHEVSIGFKFKSKKNNLVDTLILNNDIYLVDTIYLKDTITLIDTITKIDSVFVEQNIGGEDVTFKVEKGLHLVYGSYKMIDNAKNELTRLKSLGLNPIILIDSSNSYQRIVVGSFDNDNDALIELSNLKKKGFNDVWIWRVK